MAIVMYSPKAERLVEKNLSKFKLSPENLRKCDRYARNFVSLLLNCPIPEVEIQYRHPSEMPKHMKSAIAVAYKDHVIMNANLLFLSRETSNPAISPIVKITSHHVHEYAHVHDHNGPLGRLKNQFVEKFDRLLPKMKNRTSWFGIIKKKPEATREQIELLMHYRDIIDGCTDMAEARAFRLELEYIRHTLRVARECYWDEEAHNYLRASNKGYYSLLSAYLALEKSIGFENAWHITTYIWFKDRIEGWNGTAFAERVLNSFRNSNI